MAFATDMLDHHERGIDAADLATSRAEDRVVAPSAQDLIQLQSSGGAGPARRPARPVRGRVEEGDLGVPQTTLDPHGAARARTTSTPRTPPAMIAHHEAAIRMSAAERRAGVHAELRRMAGDITDLARSRRAGVAPRVPPSSAALPFAAAAGALRIGERGHELAERELAEHRVPEVRMCHDRVGKKR